MTRRQIYPLDRLQVDKQGYRFQSHVSRRKSLADGANSSTRGLHAGPQANHVAQEGFAEVHD